MKYVMKLLSTGQSLQSTLVVWNDKLNRHVAISVRETEAFSKTCAAWLRQIDEFEEDSQAKAQRFTEEQMHEYDDLGMGLQTHSKQITHWLTTFKNPQLDGPHDWKITRERIYYHISRCIDIISEQRQMLKLAVTRFRDDDLWTDTDCNPYLIISSQ